MSVDEQTRPERPPTSGPGSGAAAWREYAAAVTGTRVDEWTERSREDVIACLDDTDTADGAETPDADADADVVEAPAEPQPQRPARRRGPVWMVPTAEGLVPEHELRGR